MDCKFQIKQIVWAKVTPFPWWPGKILNIHIQGDELVYKILFFADPTYAYIKQSHIQPFQAFDRKMNMQNTTDIILLRAIRLADEAFARKKQNFGDNEVNSIQRVKSQKQVKRLILEDERQSQVSKQSQKLQFLKKQNHNQIEIKDCNKNIFVQNIMQNNRVDKQNIFEEITTQNILQILRKRRNQRLFQYNYESRKQIIRYKAQLQQKLLQRYSLQELQENVEFDKQKSDINSKKIIRSKLKINRRRTNPMLVSHRLKQKCIKKLYMVSKRIKTKESFSVLRQFCLTIIARITEVSDQNQSKFRSLFLGFLRTLKAELSLEESLAEFSNYLERSESEKQQDEQGSKMTQISLSLQMH